MLDVLLLDAQYRQVLTAMRSYGRSALSVGAAACVSDARWAPSLRSRWCSKAFVLPDFADDPNRYVDDTIALLEETGAPVVIPAHDGSIEALRARRAEVERHAALPIASDAALGVAMSKPRTLDLANQLGIAVPDGVEVVDEGDVDRALSIVGAPAVLKPASSWAVTPDGLGTRLVSEFVRDGVEARRALATMRAAGSEKALLQRWLPGAREAVTMFRADGRTLARFAQVSHREWPLLGGVSTACESIALPKDIADAADRLVGEIDLEGCSMVEFRRDAEGRPFLMEINPRMGSNTALAVRAGVDFPTMLYRWATGSRIRVVERYTVGVHLRWPVGELWFLNAALRHPGQPDAPSRAQALRSVLHAVGPPRPSGLRDLRPAIVELRHTLQVYGAPLLRRALARRA